MLALAGAGAAGAGAVHLDVAASTSRESGTSSVHRNPSAGNSRVQPKLAGWTEGHYVSNQGGEA